MKFSERMRFTPVERVFQRESMNDDLRNSLWSLLTLFVWESFASRSGQIAHSNLRDLFVALWLDYFKQPVDTIPTYFHKFEGGLEVLRQYYFSASWHEVYDFVEFVKDHAFLSDAPRFESRCNEMLERENAAYRFVGGKLVEMTSAPEIQAVEDAINEAASFSGVQQHLSRSLELLADRANPDYRNSIKESISAVGSICRQLGGEKATLEEALKVLESKKVLHPALKKAFSSLYGYTSDASGVRHELMAGKDNPTSAEARFMLVTCSAFVNYVVAMMAEGGQGQA